MRSYLRTSSLATLLVIAVACDQDPVTPEPQPPGPPQTEAELVQALNTAYTSMDLAAFTNLFPTAGEAEYLFLLDDGSSSWGCDVELRVHQRMFRPQDTPVGDDPVPPELELREVSLSLAPVTEFEERTDLYQPLGPLDPIRWSVRQAQYHALIVFGTLSETDYSVDGRVIFLIINDLDKPLGADRKFLIYRWEDLGNFMKASG